MQNPLGISVRLIAPSEHEVERGLELDARARIGRHRAVGRIARVLPVHHPRHPLERGAHLRLVGHPVPEPVRDVLARYAERRPILHQGDIADVGHLRASHPLTHPPHDVAEDPLCVVVELAPDLVRCEVPAREERDREDVVESRPRASGDLLLALRHVLAVIVHGVQDGGGRRRDPRGVRAGTGMADLLRHHVGHRIGGGPHALADLSAAREPGCEPHVDVPVLVRRDPARRLHLRLRDDRPRFHRGVDLVTGAVEEAGVDEDDAGFRGADALAKVHGGAPFLVHDADLDGVAGETECVLDPIEQLDGGGDLLRAVELRLDDVDAAGAAVRELAAAVEIVLRGQHRDHCVEEAFRDLVAVRVEHRVGVHVEADVAQEHEAATGQLDGAAAGGAVGAVGSEAAHDFPAALGERGFEVALHQAEPVAVHPRLVLGVHCGHRVLAVLDGGDRRLDHDVPDAGPAQLADRVLAVDVQLDVQPVVPQQHA